jgi:hypothetical protein
MKEWDIDPLGLWAAWRAFGHDFLPNPLQHLTGENLDSAGERMLAQWDGGIYDVLHVMATAHARVEVEGRVYHKARKKVRIHAAIRGRVGAALIQRPGPADDLGGSVVVSLLDAGDVAERIIDAVPPAPPGRQRSVGISPQRMRSDEYPFQSWDPWNPTPEQQMHALDKQPRDLDLDMCFFVGPDIVENPVPSQQAQLLDIVGDGRYLARCAEPEGFRADPVDKILARAYIQGALTRAATARRG